MKCATRSSKFYLDTSAVYSFVFEDAHSAKIDRWIDKNRSVLVVSDWLETEFFALVNRRVRTGGLTHDAADIGLADFETLVRESAQRIRLSPVVGARATQLARDPKLKLSAADALHLALSAEDGHCLVTFDMRLAEAGRPADSWPRFRRPCSLRPRGLHSKSAPHAPKIDQPIRFANISSAIRPRCELPLESRPGDQTAIEALPGTTANMPPPTPLLPGRPTR